MSEEMKNKEEQEVLMEQITPEDLPSEQEKNNNEFIPSPTWKRALAWILVVIVILGIATWLINIACPHWVETIRDYFRH